MNQREPIERSIATWMVEEGRAARNDDAVELMLTRTAAIRPRPRWLVLLTERPMRRNAAVAVGSPARRLVLVAALVMLALAASAAVVAAFLLKPLPTDDWSGYRGSPGRTTAGINGPVGHPIVRWQFHAEGSVPRNVSVAGDLALFASDDGLLHAVELATGQERWRFELGGGTGDGPLAWQGQVYVADSAGLIHALALSTGARLWRTTEAVTRPGDLTIGDGRLYAGTEDGLIVAIDASTGTERWRKQVSPRGQPVHPPAFDAGRVFASSDDGGLVALDAATGEAAWSVDTGGDETLAAVAANGIVYIGAGPSAVTGHVRAVDQARGRPLWTIDENVTSPSVGTDGRAFVGSGDGMVAAIDPTSGRMVWRIQFEGVTRSPAIAGDILFVAADGERRVVALDAASGGELWSIDVDGPLPCCISVGGGLVLVGTGAGTVYAIAGDGTAISPAPRPTTSVTREAPSAAASPTPAAVPAREPVVAKFDWARSAPDPTFVSEALARAPDGRLWLADVANSRFGIFSPDGAFAEYWGEPGTGPGQFDLNRSTGDGFGGIAFAKDGSFYVLDVGNYRVQQFDAKRRFVRQWGGFGSDPGKLSDPLAIAVAPNGDVLVYDDVRRVVETYESAGMPLRSFDPLIGAQGSAGTFAVDGEGNVYVGVLEPNEVRRFDRFGTLTGTFGSDDTLPKGPNGAAVDDAGRLYVASIPTAGLTRGVTVFGRDGNVLGSWGEPGTAEGQLGFPWSVALDGDGHAFVSELGGDPAIPSSNRIQRFTLTLPAP